MYKKCRSEICYSSRVTVTWCNNNDFVVYSPILVSNKSINVNSYFTDTFRLDLSRSKVNSYVFIHNK